MVIISLSNANAHACLHRAFAKYVWQWQCTRPSWPIFFKLFMSIWPSPHFLKTPKTFVRAISSLAFFDSVGSIIWNLCVRDSTSSKNVWLAQQCSGFRRRRFYSSCILFRFITCMTVAALIDSVIPVMLWSLFRDCESCDDWMYWDNATALLDCIVCIADIMFRSTMYINWSTTFQIKMIICLIAHFLLLFFKASIHCAACASLVMLA